MAKKTIKIAGAGISGLTAALNLTKAGYKVEVYDRSDITGKRFHGDFQGIENWSFEQDATEFMRKINIKINFDCTGFKKMSAWGPDNYQKNFSFNRPAFYLVKRGIEQGCLDYGLQQQVNRYNNINIVYNHPVKNDDVDIVAAGPFRRDPYTDAMASGFTFTTNIKNFGVLIFDNKYAPDGYSYFLVNNGHGVIATCIFNKYSEINHFRDKTLELCKKHINFNMKDIKNFSGIGNFFLSKIPTNKKIYVGEAGGNQDYLWFFGMRYAMLTGYLAAKSIIESKDYYDIYQKELLPKLKVSVSNRLLFKLFGKKSYKTFINMFAKASDPISRLGKFYNPSLLKTLLYPIAMAVYRKHVRDPRQLD